MPLTPLQSRPALVSGGLQDPLLPQLLDAINAADEIDLTVAFIRQSGLELIFEALKDARERGAVLRLLTSDYLDVTEPTALRRLMVLAERGADMRIYPCSGDPSFHIKSYIFVRRQGEALGQGCAFVGSSNLSRMALERGLEWNLRIDYPAQGERFEQVLAGFHRLFADPLVVPLSHAWIDGYVSRRGPMLRAIAGEPEDECLPAVPSAIQAEALVALQQSRAEGFTRGLVVLATGLGKSWLAAFDATQIKARRVLFVAHREEILQQAEETFARIRPEASFGYYSGREKVEDSDHLFASVQTLGREEHLRNFAADHFDYIVVDEFHHADAPTYRRLLNHFRPRFLLGLTATPERTDQADILSLCDDNLVFERNLVEGIEAGLLAPFDYHGIHDHAVDYAEIPWRNGRFDPNALSHKLATLGRARHALKVWREQAQSRTLAFCVSRSHAEFMAEQFVKAGVRAAAVHAASTLPRNQALEQLKSGALQVLFSVDLFNEGTDLPAIDTVMMLRPTESKILFLQQLGRGLRLHPEKSFLRVLDFIGNHRAFLNKPESLFGIGSIREFLARQKRGALPLPKGCFANYELGVIDFLTQLVKGLPQGIVEHYQTLLAVEQRRPTAVEFQHAGIDFGRIRKGFGSWFELVAQQGGLNDIEQRVLKQHGDFLREIETTAMTKSYKMVLLEALLELDGFITPPTVTELARRSGELMLRRRPLIVQDLPHRFQDLANVLAEKTGSWLSYWKGNPINAFIGGNRSRGEAFFRLQDDRFMPNFVLAEEDREAFTQMLQELVDYKLAIYMAREEKPSDSVAAQQQKECLSDWNILPFFPNLAIACGHFRRADGSIEGQVRIAPLHRVDPARHFVARASGNSMNGGKQPVCDGDYLLLEWVNPARAGSITGQVMALERQDVGGDDQYVLRQVKKRADNTYYLRANNPDYPDFDANEEMRPFARLKAVIPVGEIEPDEG